MNPWGSSARIALTVSAVATIRRVISASKVEPEPIRRRSGGRHEQRRARHVEVSPARPCSLADHQEVVQASTAFLGHSEINTERHGENA